MKIAFYSSFVFSLTFQYTHTHTHTPIIDDCDSLNLKYNDRDEYARKLDENDATALAELLAEKESITTITLRYNEIGDNGAIAFSSLLESSTSITSIDLGNNGISVVGAVALAEAIKSNTALKTLHLWGNSDISSGDGAIALADAVVARECLLSPIKINVGANSFTTLIDERKADRIKLGDIVTRSSNWEIHAKKTNPKGKKISGKQQQGKVIAVTSAKGSATVSWTDAAGKEEKSEENLCGLLVIERSFDLVSSSTKISLPYASQYFISAKKITTNVKLKATKSTFSFFAISEDGVNKGKSLSSKKYNAVAADWSLKIETGKFIAECSDCTRTAKQQLRVVVLSDDDGLVQKLANWPPSDDIKSTASKSKSKAENEGGATKRYPIL